MSQTLPHLSEVIDQATSFNDSLNAYGLLTLAPTNPANQEIKQAGNYLGDFLLLTPTTCCDTWKKNLPRYHLRG